MCATQRRALSGAITGVLFIRGFWLSTAQFMNNKLIPNSGKRGCDKKIPSKQRPASLPKRVSRLSDHSGTHNKTTHSEQITATCQVKTFSPQPPFVAGHNAQFFSAAPGAITPKRGRPGCGCPATPAGPGLIS